MEELMMLIQKDPELWNIVEQLKHQDEELDDFILSVASMLSVEFDELRQSWMPFPYVHIYQHPVPIASASINRVVDDREAVVFGMIQKPESKPLVETTEALHFFKNKLQPFRMVLMPGKL